jgi:hypothetical protein
MKRKIKWFLLSVVSLICLLIILHFPLNRYEWMLVLDPEETALPLDDDAGMYPFVAGTPALLLSIVLFVFSRNSVDRYLSFLVVLLLFCVWIFKFHSLLGT